MRDDDEVETTALTVVTDLAGSPDRVVADRYRLTTVLGHGANADVYRAHDERLDREVAIKLFHPGQGAVARFRFGAEARALARVSHAGLVGIFDAGVADDDRPYLVMELVDGESLREKLLSGPLATDDVVLLGARLSVALAHAHGNGVVHRDIKPSNIVLDANGSPHLADFGIALLLDAARPDWSTEIMGTAAYLAPEQILGVDVGSSADVYSLGLVLLECLTGELEYPGLSKVESALTRLHRQPRIPDHIPGVLAELLTAMTAREPERRPAAGDCAAWFWAIREHDGMSGRAARAAAASWLAKNRKQFRSRPSVPVLRVAFTGWRRFMVAGAGIAMAVLASTWLFTSLLPRFMPLPPALDEAAPPPASVGIAPHIGIMPNGPVMHVAAALDGARPSAPPAPPRQTQLQAGAVDLITSAMLGPPAVTTTPNGAVPAGNGNQLQDYGVRQTSDNPPSATAGPASTDQPTASPTAEPSPTATPTPTASRTAAATPPVTPGPPTSTADHGAASHPPPTTGHMRPSS
ncbi:MAG TPA: serine/threonine-protein kinase [Pseudonocardiaceae bacterium]|nr:serine/threonine-protein kinase [Pseudonocardiaceae bacterium]